MNKNETRKSENPADYFVAQHNDVYQPKATVEDETKEIEKTVIENGKGKANGNVTQNDELTKAMESLDTSMMMTTTNGKPKVYEPTERERDLLENLELSSIVIESDPNDPNRYFQKADPGDWYRVIMKQKAPKGDKSKRKKSKSKESSQRHSSQTDTTNSSGTKEKRHRRKSKQDSSDDNGASVHKHKNRKSKSGDRNDPERTISRSVDLSKAYEAMLETGKLNDTSFSAAAANSMPQNPHESPLRDSGMMRQMEPKVIVSKPVVVNSKPKEPDPPKTRIIMSQSSHVKTPTMQQSHTVQEPAQSVINSAPTVINSQPVRTREPVNTTEVQASPARPRSNLFGPRGGSLRESSAEKTSTETQVKRPDIVPPLNLTGSGDQVEIDDDGFEGFVLNH